MAKTAPKKKPKKRIRLMDRVHSPSQFTDEPYKGSAKGIYATRLKLNAQITAAFAEKVAKGVPITVAADLLRVARSTLYHWLAKAREYEEDREAKVEDYLPFLAFAQEIAKAKAEYLESLIDNDLHSEHKDTRRMRVKINRAIQILSRRDSANWALWRKDQGEEVDPSSGYDPDLKYI